MSEIGNFLDGRGFLMGSPFRSVYFLITSVVGVGCIVVDVYLLYRYRQTLTISAALMLSTLIGLQLIYQWWRVLRYRAKILEAYSKGSEEEVKGGSPLDVALRVAAGGMIDLLFFSYGITLVALILVGFLLSRLDGLAGSPR